MYAVEDEVGLAKALRSQGKIGICWKMKPLSSSRRTKQGLWKYWIFLLRDYWGAYYWSSLTHTEVEYVRID
jgi:hypothetical protein